MKSILIHGLVFALASTGTVFAQQAPPTVDVANPVIRKIQEWDQYTGRFRAKERVEIRARVSGYLESIHFEDGQIVEAGDLLYIIDARPYEAEVARANAGVLNAKSQLILAEIELTRADELLKRSTLSQSEVDRRKAQRDAAAADVQSAEAQLRTAELDLEFSRVSAPIGGRISDTKVTVGNVISGGSTQASLLATIVSIDPIYFEFDVSERAYLKYARLFQMGELASPRTARNPVYVRIAGETEWTRRGEMNFLANEIGENTGTIRGRAVFDNQEGILQAGLFGQIRIIGSNTYEAVLIPDVAVVSDQSSKLVMVVGDGNVVAAQPVTLGPIVDGLRVVRSGLTGAETIVVNGVQRARSGAPVTPNPVEVTVKPDGLNAAPDPTPAAANTKPAAANTKPAATNPTPAAASPTPAAANPTPAATNPTPAAASPTPAAADPTPAAADPTPAAAE